MSAMQPSPEPGACGRFDEAQLPALRAAARDRPPSVLYIEDNAVNAMLMEAIVGLRSDVRLRISVDGASAVRDATAETPDLLLVDMHLPDADGIELLALLRAPPVSCAAPAIVVSAVAGPDDLRRARQAGFVGYWTKPLHVERILAQFEALFGPAPDGAAC